MGEQSSLTEFDTVEALDPTNYVECYADDWYGGVGDASGAERTDRGDFDPDFDEDVST